MKKLVAAILCLTVLVPPSEAEAVVRRCPQYEWLLKAYRMPVAFFSRIMWRESGCQPQARHVNRNGTIDRGLLQLNSIHLKPGGVAHGYGPAQLYSPAVNVKLAARLYHRSGTRPWA